ncbi:MAG: serine hydrolase domain-containing protein, partial [Bacteroidota bacterium]
LSLLHLATHTSGLKKNPLTSYKRYSSYLSKVQLDYVPGKKWEYNNMGVSLLAELIAEKNNSSWSDVLRENILKPLEMTNTYSNMREASEACRVQCMQKNGTKGDCYFHKMGSFHWASGGIISNVDDMTKWLKANLNEKVEPELAFIQNAHDPLGDTIAIQWFTRHRPTQGIVWWHYRGKSGRRIIGHAGEMPQQSSFMAMDKEKRRGIIILTNVNGSKLFIDPETSEMSSRKIVLALDILDL